ncbi:MAG: hypothetical protein V4543_09105 [Bacteroidota bacterium]
MKQYLWYLENQDELAKQYYDKVIVIHDFKVYGAFDTSIEALMFGKEHFEPESFIIQVCLPSSETGPDNIVPQKILFWQGQ